jgi:hypothetical protein
VSVALDFAVLPNGDKPVIRVMHSALKRSGWSDFRSWCPVKACGGQLMVRRDQETLRIRREDACIRCGQRVFYLDDRILGEALPPRES